MMKRLAIWISAALVSVGGLANGQETVEGDGWWAFEPGTDSFTGEAMLDLRSLNEEVAGATGFIGKDAAGDFVKGDGSPIRFWAMNTNVLRELPWKQRPRWEENEPSLEAHARFLAKHGVNMVRCHSHINPAAEEGSQLTDVNEGEIDWIRRTVAAMKKEGIYTTISPYWANTMKSDDELWGTDWNEQHHNLLFFDEKLQAAYKEWLRVLFAEENPHTGIPLAKDPAVGIIQLQNEDSLLFWTFNNLKGAPRERLQKQYGDWLAKKYGSIEKAFEAWGSQPGEKDDVDAGRVDFVNLFELTQPHDQPTPRLDDQTEFLTTTMYEFNAEIARYLREDLGCEQLINAGNWKTANNARLGDAERFSYTANDVLATNRYFGGVHQGERRGWAIVPDDVYTSESVVRGDGTSGFPLNLRQVDGFPMMITESSWVFPDEFGAEGPFLVSAYGSLTGFDVFYWFATGTEQWTHPQSANGFIPSQQKWIAATPDMLGMFPAAALAFRKNYIERGEPVLREHRSLDQLWQREEPKLVEGAGFDPNRDEGDTAQAVDSSTINPLAYFAGPINVTFDSDPSKTEVADLSKLISADGTTVTSNTGQLVLNTKEQFCTINAPKIQGVTAFFGQKDSFEFDDVKVKSGNTFAAVSAASLDGEPLKSSGKILVQVGTRTRPSGWSTEPVEIELKEGGKVSGKKIVSYGGAPWLIEKADVQLEIANPDLTKATVLDPNGYPSGTIELEKSNEGVRFRFPEAALYVVLEK